MNFQEAERAYQDLRAQYAASKLSSSDFEAQVSKLKLQDAEGRWWQIGVQSGEWYVHDGQKWTKGKPPTLVAPASAPPASPEVAEAITPAGVGGAPPPTPSTGRSRVVPRLFSAAPAGRNGGLPMPVLVGIIAVVAILGIALVVGGFWWVSGNFGGAATSKTVTPTRAATTAASPAIPTLPPPPPTNLPPIVVPTVAVTIPTATVAITPTTVVTATTAAPKATVTKKPTGPTVTPTVTPTKAPAVAPGIYVTQVVLDPPAPNFNEPIGFKVTLLNTTGTGQTYNWLVKVFKCSKDPCVADDFKNSFGESTVQSATVPVGTLTVTAPKHMTIGLGTCTYVAMPYYIDPVSQQKMPFLKTDGGALYQVFTMCH